MQRATFALAFGLSLVACQSTQPTGSAVVAGQLGNGGFAFTCDDSVACNRYTNAAKTFPDAIALGSTFRIQFVPKSGTSSTGVTVGTVGDTYISVGTGQLTALKAGWGTIVARNASGAIVEFATVPIMRPDSLVIYDAAYTGTSPTPITTITLGVGESKSVRALAQTEQPHYDLAGTLKYEWASLGAAVDVASDATGKATITGASAGSAQIQVSGGTFTETITVEVTP